MYFPDVPKNGEETAANGAPPHFRIKRNFLGVNSSSPIFIFGPFIGRGQIITEVFLAVFRRHENRNENLRRSP